jgi:hypothetical protein
MTYICVLAALLAQPNATDIKSVSVMVTPGERLSNEQIAELEGVTFIADPTVIESGPRIEDADIEQIRGAPRIRSVIIGQDAHVTDKLFDVLITLPKLCSLRVDNCAVTDDGLSTLAAISTLTTIQFRGCRLTDRGVAQLARLPRLEVLNVEDCSIVGACFRELSRIRTLRELSVRGTSADDRVGRTFDGFPELQELGLRNTRVTDQLFADLSRLKALNWVDVTATRVTRKRIEKFCSRHPGVDVHMPW